jgi:hypothetical protein
MLVFDVALTAAFLGLFVGTQLFGPNSFWGWHGNFWYLIPAVVGTALSWLTWWRVRFEMHRIATLAIKYLEAAEMAKKMKASANLN